MLTRGHVTAKCLGFENELDVHTYSYGGHVHFAVSDRRPSLFMLFTLS